MRATTLPISLIFASIIFASEAFALQSDYEKPINVVSEQQMADLKANRVIFEGDVEATQGTMKINADKVEVQRASNGQLESIIAYGNPVTFEQTLDNGKPIHTKSRTLSYLPVQNLVVLSGQATIWQGESRMSGERIEYNIQTQKMRAENQRAQGGRVSSTFVPAELKNENKGD